MANSFRSSVGGYRRQAFQNAMDSLGGSTAAQNAAAASSGSAPGHLEALNRASAWQERSIGTVSDFSAKQNNMAANAMGDGLNLATTAATNKIEYKAAKDANKAQQGANTMGLIAQGIGTVLPFIACERRLKQAIAPLSPDQAWVAARDIPLYSFSYKLHPGTTCYGPIIDEVEAIDPSLVRPSLLGPDEHGPIRGFDVLRHQAMQAVALQEALRRIERLEAQLDAVLALATLRAAAHAS